MTGQITPFGTAPDGRPVERITLRNAALTVQLLTWGAVVQDLRLAGVDWPLTLGSADLAAYVGPLGYYGAVVGPVANRIAGASALIDGARHDFPPNEGANLLHGGRFGTQARVWDIASVGETSAVLRLALAAGDQGFPGARVIEAAFSLEGATLVLRLSATSDAPTLMNLANHSYWNLDGSESIAGHRLTVAADRVLETVAGLPTGRVLPAAGAPDLRQGRVIDLSEGFDHNFCLADAPRGLTEVAELVGQSGVRLRLATTEPGLQVYDGVYIDSEGFAGLQGRPLRKHEAMALEAQRWPDAPNHPGFPSIRLDPGQIYRQETRLSFDRL
ncbi:MAG: aldose epimerase family protein [Cereibacter changlensis]